MSKPKSPSSELSIRKEALASLPANIRASFTSEEMELFLHQEVWPETLCEKLSDFLFPMDSDARTLKKKA